MGNNITKYEDEKNKYLNSIETNIVIDEESPDEELEYLDVDSLKNTLNKLKTEIIITKTKIVSQQSDITLLRKQVDELLNDVFILRNENKAKKI
jgi:polyhydroxyalkanoate synthesis regulator phasin